MHAVDDPCRLATSSSHAVLVGEVVDVFFLYVPLDALPRSIVVSMAGPVAPMMNFWGTSSVTS